MTSEIKQVGMNATLDKVCQLIASHEWWIFLFATRGDGVKVITEIKERYYNNTPKDFGLMISPTVTFVIAKKSRMTKEQLGEIMASSINLEEQRSYARVQEAKEELESLKHIFLEDNKDRDVIPMLTESPELNDIVLDINRRLRLHWDALRED